MKDKLTIISSFNRPHSKSNKDYEKCARRFAWSIRNNGGKCSNCDIMFWCDEEQVPSIETIDFLKNLGCKFMYGEVVLKEPTSFGSWTSKLYCIEQCYFDTEFGVFIDIDYYCNGDFSALFEQDFDVAASAMNFSHNFAASPERDIRMWEQYYTYFGMSRPTETIITYVDKKPSNFYFSSSIIFYRNNIGFQKTYKDIASNIRISNLNFNGKRFSQTAIPLTIKMLGCKGYRLPRHMAYMYHLNEYKLENDEKDPVLIHYCDNIVTQIPKEKWNI